MKLFELLILKDTDMLKHVCPSQFSGIPLKEKTANSERSICHPSPKKNEGPIPRTGQESTIADRTSEDDLSSDS